MQYGCLKLVHFSKKSGRLSLTGSEILTFGSHCLANFQPILDCFIPKFELEYDDLENIKADLVNAVVFNLHQIKCLKLFLGHPVYFKGGLVILQGSSPLALISVKMAISSLLCRLYTF